MKSDNIMIPTLVSLYYSVTPPAHPPPTHTHTALLPIQPSTVPKRRGVGRYESTYLLAFVQRTAVSKRVLELLTSSPA